jgi:hypothetical protein
LPIKTNKQKLANKGELKMMYKRIEDQKAYNDLCIFAGSINTFNIDYDKLVEHFGQPRIVDGDEWSCQWVLKDSDNETLLIWYYTYEAQLLGIQQPESIEQVQFWTVISHSETAFENLEEFLWNDLNNQ